MSPNVILSCAVLVAAGLLLALFGEIAWRSLDGLPARQSLENASADASRFEPTARPTVAEPARDVRYVERSGIVGPRVSGTLEREVVPVVVEPPPPAEPKRELDEYRLVVIESAGIINARTHRIKLAHVAAPDESRICRRPDGSTWPCGMRARTALRRLVRRRALGCEDLPVDPEGVSADVRPAKCEVAGVDLSRWLVENGWAVPDRGAPKEWAELHADARRAGRGLFATTAR